MNPSPTATENILAGLKRRTRLWVTLGLSLALSAGLAAIILTGCKGNGRGGSGIDDLNKLLGKSGVGGKTTKPGEPTAIDKLKAGVGLFGDLRTALGPVPPDEEHQFGRAAMAHVLARYPLREDRPDLTAYVNQIGQTLALVSSKPDLHEHWTFGVVNDEAINAFSAPGGFVVVTSGAVRACADEDQLAAVIAHEVAHVELGHPLAALKEGKLLGASEKLRTVAGGQKAYGRVLTADDLIKGGQLGAKTLGTGFSADLEDAADRQAVNLLLKAGYDPDAYVGFLNTLADRTKTSAGGVPFKVSTHNAPGDRAAKVAGYIGELRRVGWTTPDVPARRTRFQAVAGKGL